MYAAITAAGTFNIQYYYQKYTYSLSNIIKYLIF
jgi:hypothetical protein